jgi:hypothetical protein
MTIDESEFIWVFNGEGGRFPSAVFRSKEAASAWIAHHGLTGLLAGYPPDVGVYDWAVANGNFKPKGERHRTPAFIQTFAGGGQPHYHFENGE